ncbi:MAG: NADH:flavin oxidoreductase [Planctomycetaceae bacterium]|nr:NADH:flavin oxidoreductase [Planctomycetaceae bacterium]|tara:strand:+ start:5622 stop:7070 length:1449 start_codon:yes stop_codon:yes gene_type:complete
MSSNRRYRRIAQYKEPETLRARFAELGFVLPCDDEIQTAAAGSPLAAPIEIGGFTVGNRWCIHPMEGWDANSDGSPTENTLRRWRNFGLSGAKLIWGGEAAAVQKDGRANPNQTLAIDENEAGIKALLDELLAAHQQKFGSTEDLLVGLQLTHSGRFCRPNSKMLEPRIAYHHPLLDAKFGIAAEDESVVWTDDQLEDLIESYVRAAQLAQRTGYRFVDVKCCHGYLLHEFLSARYRAGKYGGDYAGRTRLLRTIIQRIQQACSELMILVRLSFFDAPPFVASDEVGVPMDFEHLLPYKLGFGCNESNPLELDLTEPLQLVRDLRDLGVACVNLSCASPYYNPHFMRPASFPPSDGYQPPEDPLVGVFRQIDAVRQCKQAVPDIPLVGTGYTYLQDYLPHVAQAVVRQGWVDLVGLGRMVLSYWDLPADTLREGQMNRKVICRTFSDCTTAPRNGMISGCFPLDPYYKQTEEAGRLKELKRT